MELKVYRSNSATAALVVGHGAGAGQNSPFMVRTAEGLAARGIAAATFDFPYMTARRGAPDRPPVLEQAWRDAIAQARTELSGLPLFIGGKSMGGRISSQVAAQGVEGVSGLVFLGYPLHPPGKPEQRRIAHLPSIAVPVLIVQGERDAFGTPAELRPVVETMRGGVTLHVVEGGDHSLAVARSSGTAQKQVYEHVLDTIAAWMASVSRAAAGPPPAPLRRGA